MSFSLQRSLGNSDHAYWALPHTVPKYTFQKFVKYFMRFSAVFLFDHTNIQEQNQLHFPGIMYAVQLLQQFRFFCRAL
jgi:hypothetical protein